MKKSALCIPIHRPTKAPGGDAPAFRSPAASAPGQGGGCVKSLLAAGLAVAMVCGGSEAKAVSDETYKIDGTNSSWTSSVWSLTGTAPYTTAWTSGNNAIFNATSAITGATTTVGNITAHANVAVAAGGTMLFSNTVLSVDDSYTFSFAGLSVNTASGFTKSGNGTLTTAISTAYTGGFTMNAGTLNIGATNSIGAGTLAINGGTLQSNSGTARTPSVTQVNIGGDFSYGNTNTGGITFTAPVSLGASTRQITLDNTTSAATLSGVISGTSTTSGLTKAGLGELDIGGAASNTYTGLTTVSAGTLGLGVATAGLNAFGGDLTINGGIVSYSGARNEQIPDAAKVNISSGTLAVGARTETVGINATTASGLAISGTGAVTVSSGSLIVNNSASMSGGKITFSSSGNVTTNTDFNFSGGTIDTTYTSTGSSGLFLRGGDGTGISYPATGTSTAQILNTPGGTGMRVSLNTAANATTVFNIADAPNIATEMLIATQITGNASNALQKTGAGTLELAAASSYAGGTAINGGILRVSGTETTGTTPSGPLGVAGTISFGGGTLQYTSFNQFDYSARFSTAISQAYSVDTNGQSVTFATALNSSGGTLTKAGTGTLTLTANNTFAGATTVNAGTLNAAGSGTNQALGATTQVSINNGGTLLLGSNSQINSAATVTLGSSTGTGTANFSTGNHTQTVGALTLSAPANITLGGGASSLTFGSVSTFATGATLSILNYAGLVYQSDGVTMSGTAGDTLFINGLSSPQLAQVQFVNPSGYSGTFPAISDANGEVFAQVPEPATVLGGVMLIAATGWSQRRRLRVGIASA